MKKTTIVISLILASFSPAIIAEEESEIGFQLAPIGVEYKKLTGAVSEGSRPALRLFLALSLDGAASTELMTERPELLKMVEDKELATALKGFSKETIQAIAAELVDGLSPEKVSALKNKMPKTFAVIQRGKKSKD
ncbi:MAG: hypothetical protein ACI8UO_004402 [Verrucomicrobiales bacterium]|jgi:hypothetical protein